MITESLRDISSDYKSYQRLITLYSQNKDQLFEDVHLSLDGWFSANICPMLGAVTSLFQSNINTVHLTAGSAQNILERNGFLAFFGHSKLVDLNNTAIPYQVLSTEDDRYFNNYVFKEFLSKPDLPVMTVPLKKKLLESIYEIFINAKMHSKTKRIFVCGQFFPAKKRIEFMITDIGLGIKNVVNTRFSSNLTAVQAIDWAVKDRNTTKQGVSGGIGLTLLHEFININRGTVQIVSNEGFWQLNDGTITKQRFVGEFPGTAVNISVRTNDRNSYRLTSEK